MERAAAASAGNDLRTSAKLHFVCPDDDTPTGGVRVIYRHVDRLNELGYSAQVVHEKPGFRCTWFPNSTPVAYLPELGVHPARDILVFPEIYGGPGLTEVAPGIPRVIFNQGAYLTFQTYSLDPADKRTPYHDPNLLGVLVVSEDSRAYLQHAFPAVSVDRIHGSIDSATFKPAALKRPQIAFMPRRQEQDIRQVLSILKFRGVLDGIDLVPIEGLAPERVAAVLAESQFFMSTPRQEGFGLPPVEAMASGCVVIGYHGFGGREYFLEDFSFPVEYGDVVAFAKTMEKVIEWWRREPEKVAALGERAMRFVRDEYSQQREDEDLDRVWSTLIARRNGVSQAEHEPEAGASVSGLARPAVTIVIPAWNAVKMTRNCLLALRPTLGPDDQVVVVDNGSEDETAEILAAQDWIDVVTNEKNEGFAAGCNAGARQARNPVLVFLNNDTVPTPGWIEGLVAPFVDSQVGATGPMSNYVSGPQLLPDPEYQPQTVDDIARYANVVRAENRGQRQEVNRLVGFCVAVRTSVFMELGGFDESFGIGSYEDDDLSNRLRFAGWRLIIVKDTFVHHFGHQTFVANEIDVPAIDEENSQKLQQKLSDAFPVSFMVLCGSETVPLIATLVGIQQTMGSVPFEVVLLIPDREPLTEVLEGVGGATVVDVPGVPEERAWQMGHHTATGVRRALLRAGEAVNIDAVQRLLDTAPHLAQPTPVGMVMERTQPQVPAA
jgi:GT2 family glycosyltransferase